MSIKTEQKQKLASEQDPNHIKQGIYLLLDTEASGIHPHKHGLLEVAAVVLDDGLNIVGQYQTYINPPEDVLIDPVAMELTGISQREIESGISYQDFCSGFIQFVKENFDAKPIVVAQFYPFDAAYLNYVFEYCGYNKLLFDILGNDFVDTKSLVNQVNMRAKLNNQPIPYPITSLSKEGGLKDVLGIEGEQFRAHSAMGDVLATLEVLRALMR